MEPELKLIMMVGIGSMSGTVLALRLGKSDWKSLGLYASIGSFLSARYCQYGPLIKF